jgi:hypothetical protein
MDDLNAFNPDLAKTEVIGMSSENRPLKLIKIGTQIKDPNKPIIWIDAGLVLMLYYQS